SSLRRWPPRPAMVEALRPSRVLSWVDGRFGPVRQLSTVRLGHPEPPWWVATASLARVPAGSYYRPFPLSAGGVSIDRREALLRVAGEVLERSSALEGPVDAVAVPAGSSGVLALLPRCAP